MRRGDTLAPALLAGLLTGLWSVAAEAREAVSASSPQRVAVTIYRDPDRAADQRMNADWPEGFAMISETRTVTLPPGESTILFEGVAEGMASVTAIVTGLPGGVIEKNRNAQLLSPAALVDGTLGNRVTVTRTNPATGKETSESAVVRTRADGGIVLQTREGFEAVRCSGLPERLGFDRVPAGLSAQPVFSVNTNDPRGGTYRITLTYLSAGFDWQAHYVATFLEGDGKGSERTLRLLSWLTLANDNGQSFADAELMAVAGKLNVESDYSAMADPLQARPIQLSCYPIGSTAAGSPLPLPPPPPPAPPMAAGLDESIMVTAMRRNMPMMSAPAAVAMVAREEQLGDLKLFRVPEPVTVAAKSLKQVAFLDKRAVKGALLYTHDCTPGSNDPQARPLAILLETRNDERHGLGSALPMGGMTLFEPSEAGEQLVGETPLRDYAVGQDIELPIGESRQVHGQCTALETTATGENAWAAMRAELTNANSDPVKVRVVLGPSTEWELQRRPAGTRIKDGRLIVEISVPANATYRLAWKIRPAR